MTIFNLMANLMSSENKSNNMEIVYCTECLGNLTIFIN